MVYKKKISRKMHAKMTVSLPSQRRKVRLAIDCTPEERRLIKTYASYEDKTLTDYVLDCVRMKMSGCHHSHIPNEETAAALDLSERGDGIIMFDSIDDFFKSMEA